MNKKIELDKEIVEPLLGWFYDNKRILPWRENTDPYRVWVSEIMLQQTRVEAVKPYFERFMKELPTVKALSQAPEEKLLKLWEGLGYYNRVRNMQKAAVMIEEQYDGHFPDEFASLLRLPGIGAYTAGAIASISFQKPTPAVDGNVLRILTRLLAYDGDILSQKVKNETQDALLPVMPAKYSGDFNQAMMELGATVCVPNGAPHCDACPWNKLCEARAAGTQLEYPKKTPKKKRSIEEKTILILGDGKKLLLHKRPPRGLLASMYELPGIDGFLAEEQIVEAVRALGFAPLKLTMVKEAKHIFTHKEWHMRGWVITVEPVNFMEPALELKDAYFLVEKEQIEREYPIPAAFAAFTEYLDIKVGNQFVK